VVEPPPPKPSTDEIVEKRTGDAVAPVDTPDAPTRFSEKKRLDWAGETCRFTLRILSASLMSEYLRPGAAHHRWESGN
jgi:hypothetical protein